LRGEAHLLLQLEKLSFAGVLCNFVISDGGEVLLHVSGYYFLIIGYWL
jgi:hypothetical protein